MEEDTQQEMNENFQIKLFFFLNRKAEFPAQDFSCIQTMTSFFSILVEIFPRKQTRGKKETEEESTKEGKFVGGVFIHALLHMKQFQVAH